MTGFVKMDCYTGMRLRIGIDRSVSWQPNKFAGTHGARFSVMDNDGLADMVLAKRPKGSWVKITRHGEVLCYEKGSPVMLGSISSPPKLEFEKVDPDPEDPVPGMIWSGPFDGEYHHFCDDRFWVQNIHGKRCHYSECPAELRSALEKFKPLGGSFVVTPWRHVIGVIKPQPLPEAARSDWDAMSDEQHRLIQIRVKGARMLPVYICNWDDVWEVELDEPVDFSKPFTEEEISEMKGFLAQYSASPKVKTVEEEVKDAEEIEELLEESGEIEEVLDDDDFFTQGAMGLMYTPSDD